jgi:hypothetical protein
MEIKCHVVAALSSSPKNKPSKAPHETTEIAKEDRPVVNRLNAALRPYLQRGGKVPWQRLDENS